MNDEPKLTHVRVGNGEEVGTTILGLDPGIGPDKCVVVGFKYEPGGAFSSHDRVTEFPLPLFGNGLLTVVERRYVKHAQKPAGSMRQRKHRKGRMFSYTVKFFPNHCRRDSLPAIQYLGENLFSIPSVDPNFLASIHQAEGRFSS